jgi:Tfp pilus assembly protein PilF
MATERIKQLQQYCDEDPSDPFNIYALALEYRNVDPLKARELFDALLRHHSTYLPTYYHAAKFFQEQGENSKAVGIYEVGIALAKKLKDDKTLRELRSAYDELMFE